MIDYIKGESIPISSCSTLVRICTSGEVVGKDVGFEVLRNAFELEGDEYLSVNLLNYYEGNSDEEKLLNLYIRKTHGPKSFGINNGYFFVLLDIDFLLQEVTLEKILFQPDQGEGEDEDHAGIYYLNTKPEIDTTNELKNFVNQQSESRIISAKKIIKAYKELGKKEFTLDEVKQLGNYNNIKV